MHEIRDKTQCTQSKVYLLVALAGLWMNAPAWAKDGEKEQVSMQTGFVADRGELEFELVPRFTDGDDGETFESTLEIAYGWTDRLAMELEIPYLVLDPASGERQDGLGDVELELKYSLFRDPDDTRALAVGAEISFPTGDEDRGTGRGEFAGEVFVAFTRSFSDLAVHLNLGLELEEELEDGEEELETEFEYGVAVEWEFAEETALLAALVGATGDEGTELSLIPGIEWEWEGERSEIVLGLGLPIGLTDETPDWGVVAIVEVEFGLGDH
jgi:hypothetical protein